MHIWDGQNGVDPHFVGEYLAATVGALADHVDWRVLPGSPLRNRSFAHPAQGPRGFLTQPDAGDKEWNYATAIPEELHCFYWNGEHWGNPRVLDGVPDIGFDEASLVIRAGNWSNDSNSHNQPGFMHTGLGLGNVTRYFILPENAAGVQLRLSGRWLRLHAEKLDPPAPSTGDGWIQPPGSQSPPANLATLPAGYRTKYIAYTSLPWAEFHLDPTLVPLQSWLPLGGVTPQPSLDFMRLTSLDNERAGSSCEHTYFNLQALLVEGAGSTQALLRSNMIGGYR